MTKKIRLQAPFGDLGCQRPGITLRDDPCYFHDEDLSVFLQRYTELSAAR